MNVFWESHGFVPTWMFRHVETCHRDRESFLLQGPIKSVTLFPQDPLRMTFRKVASSKHAWLQQGIARRMSRFIAVLCAGRCGLSTSMLQVSPPPSGNRSRERGSFEATFGTLKHVRDPLPFPLVSGL